MVPCSKMQDNNFKNNQDPLTHYWCNRTKFHSGASSQHQDIGSFQISSFLAISLEGKLNSAISIWDPQVLTFVCQYFTLKGGMFLSWSPLLHQQLHFWAHWDGSVQLGPCAHMSKSPLDTLLPGFGQARSSWAHKFGCIWSPVEAAAFLQNTAGWKMLNALQQPPRSGLQGSFFSFGKGFKLPLLTFQRVCNRGQGRLCFTCWTCSALWKSEVFSESQKVSIVPE